MEIKIIYLIIIVVNFIIATIQYLKRDTKNAQVSVLFAIFFLLIWLFS